MDNNVYVPPLNFSIVAPGVYRSGYPNRKNHPFLQKLGLRSVIYLCPDEISAENAAFFDKRNIQVFHMPMNGNKEPFTQMDKDVIIEVMQQILDTRNHPILVHCNKGKHRVGCVMGLLRKLQNWSVTSIFDEYKRFAGTKTRIADQELIELFDGPIVYHEDFKPSWL